MRIGTRFEVLSNSTRAVEKHVDEETYWLGLLLTSEFTNLQAILRAANQQIEFARPFTCVTQWGINAVLSTRDCKQILRNLYAGSRPTPYSIRDEMDEDRAALFRSVSTRL